MDDIELVPGEELGARLRKSGERRVRFKLTFEEIPPPVYEQNNREAAVGPKQPAKPSQVQRVPSTLKKSQFRCVDARDQEGKISINAGRVVFAPDSGVAEGYWAVSLGDISNATVRSVNMGTFSIEFHIHDKKTVVFTNFYLAQNAFRALVSNAEVLGYVIALDQVIVAPHCSPESMLVGLDPDELRKSPNGEPLSRGSSLKLFASRKTRRFTGGGFNLDLSYITRKCIVMAFPGRQSGVSWNRPNEVQRFLSTRHEHSFMVYNLNADPAFHYGSERFDGRVRRFGIEEHAPPSLGLLQELMRDLGSFVRQSPKNVVALHCRAGKQRSGVVACAWLLHSRLVATAEDAVALFTAQRMRKGKKALVLPSHLRYIKYAEIVTTSGPPQENTLTLQSVELTPFPSLKGGVVINVVNRNRSWDLKVPGESDTPVVEFAKHVVVSDEVKLEIRTGGGSVVCRVFFNTRMVERSPLKFEWHELDPCQEFSQLPATTVLTLHADIGVPDKPLQKRGSLSLSKDEEAWLQQQLKAAGNAEGNDGEEQGHQGNGVAELGAGPAEGEEKRASIRSLPGENDKKPRPVQRKPTGWVSRKSHEPEADADHRAADEAERGEEGEAAA